jgi:hypothetical protein
LVKVWKAYIDATPLQVANLLDLGYMGVQNDSHCIVCMYCHLERIGRKVNSQMKKKVQ